MKKILTIVFICIFTCFLNRSFAYENGTYKVIKVIDGDTLFLDFNNDGIPQQEEKVRINGIDTFEVKPSVFLEWQMKEFNLTQNEALGLGYFGKEFVKKNLLNKYVKAEYTGNTKLCDMGRQLMSIYYDNGKNYEQEVLKAGLATVYKKSNLAPELYKYENLDKIKANVKKTHWLNLVLLNKKNNTYHKVNCEYGLMASNVELIQKPILSRNLKMANCCEVKNKDVSKYASYADDSIEVYFLDPTVDYKKVPNSALKSLIDLIYKAKKRIYFAVYGISEWDVVNALLDKYHAGLDIQWVTDVNKFGKNNYNRTEFLEEKIPKFKTDSKQEELQFNNRQEVQFFIKNQKIEAEFTDDEIKYFTDQLMHNKFFIFDFDKITTGSANISYTCIGGMNTNANDFLVIKSPKVNEIYAKEFSQMINGNFHRDKKPIDNKKNIRLSDGTILSIYFAPMDRDFLQDVTSVIKLSNNFIYVPMFYLTDSKVTQALIDAKERGVDVRVILDASSAMSKYSKHKILRIANIPVKVENWVGKMHMKALITERYVVTGSLNWTSRAQYFNDENSLIIDNPKVASAYKKHFLRLYASIPDKWLNKDPKPEGKDSPGSCSDRLDNDHDGYTDMDDLDCNPNAKQGKPFEDYYEKLD